MRYQRLNFASGTSLGTPEGEEHCVRGRGRGSHAEAGTGVATLWFCLRGQLEVETSEGVFALRGRQFLYQPGTHPVKGIARDAADWVVLAWTPARGGTLRGRARQPSRLYPLAMPMDRPLLRAAVTLLRALESGNGPASVTALGLRLDAAQAQASLVDGWLERACGRSQAHRRQVLLRLLAPRNRILNEPFTAHDLDGLAAAARYSKSHFLRLFRDVFGQTPHDLLIATRMELAKDLIAGSHMAIAEVAASVGYESRYAFSRLFKKRVGVTASDFRNEQAADSAGAPLRKAA